MFFPYTQYMQATTVDVATDIPVSGGGASDGDGDGNDCFIATAAYGTPCTPLGLLREFRERYLRTQLRRYAFPFHL